MKLHQVPLPGPGSLAIVTRPRGGDWLDDDLRNLARTGVHALVSALERSEEAELGLELEAATAKTAGLVHISIPIRDRSVPEGLRSVSGLSQIMELLQSAKSVAVHCRMGIGRSTLICGAVLVSRGVHWETAWQILRSARGVDVPDTLEQRAWLEHFHDSRP